MLASQITSNRPKLPTAAIVGSRVQDDTNRPTAPNDIISKNKPSRPAAKRPQSMLVDHDSDSGISAIRTITTAMNPRSEERRGGKECVSRGRYRGSPDPYKKKQPE